MPAVADETFRAWDQGALHFQAASQKLSDSARLEETPVIARRIYFPANSGVSSIHWMAMSNSLRKRVDARFMSWVALGISTSL